MSVKVLWVCNYPLADVAKDLNMNFHDTSGWLSGYAKEIVKSNLIELHICFPILGSKKIVKGKVKGINYYSFYQPRMLKFLPVPDQLHASVMMRKHLQEILQEVNPDILHIFGTEFPHSLVAAQIFNNPDKTVVSIQGLVSEIWKYYTIEIPTSVQYKLTLSSLVRGNVKTQSLRMKKRGKTEIEVLQYVSSVIGRTDWDKANSLKINPKLKYYSCNEILRDSFYSDKWELSNCRKNQIFMSQASYPIKGLHIMIKALSEVVKKYPSVELCIAGNDFTNRVGLYNRLKFSSYASYVYTLAKKNGVLGKIRFMGHLDEYEMKKQYLNCNMFILPSTIENSSNSLGEALSLGVPCIASYVGGNANYIKHNESGFLYQCNAPEMLAYYIVKMIENPELTQEFSIKARKDAAKIYNRESNSLDLIHIYNEIYDGEVKK